MSVEIRQLSANFVSAATVSIKILISNYKIMAKKTAKKRKQTQAVSTETKNKPSFAGASVFIEKAPIGSQKEKEQKLIRITAKALGISPFGVNILGDLPYINKLGLQTKARQYTISMRFETTWQQLALDDTMKAIVSKRLVYKLQGDSEERTGEQAIGECSPSTTKMGTLKGYQNQIAETRAKNRAILAEFGDTIHADLLTGIAALAERKEASASDLAQIGNAVSSSAEEVQHETSEKIYTAKDNDSKARREFKQYALRKGAPIGAEVKFIAETLGITEKDLNFNDLTEKEIFRLKTDFMTKVPRKEENADQI